MSDPTAQHLTYENGTSPSQPYQNSPRPSLEWRDYGLILLERAWIAVSVLVLVMTVAVFRANQKIPMYRAAARIQMDVAQAKSIKDDEIVNINTRDYTFISTQVKILESRTLAAKVAERLALTENRLFLPGASTPSDLAGAIRSAVSIHEVGGTRMVDVIATHTVAKMAAAIATAVAETFLEENLNQNMEASIEAIDWLRKQAEEYKASLEKSELALQEYKEKTFSSSLVDAQSVVMVKLQEISGALTQVETECLNLQSECDGVSALQESGGNLAEIDVIASDSTVKSIQAEILNKQTDIAVLLGRYKDQHPTLVQARKELEELEGKLDKGCAAAVQGLRARLAAETARALTLRDALDRQQKEAFQLERKLMSYHELERNVQADRELYDSVLTRMKETSMAGQLKVNNARLVDAAAVPNAPFNISRQRDLMQAGILGAVIGIGLCFLAHFVDDRIKRTEDLEQTFGLPVLAAIPRISKRSGPLRARMADADRQSPAAEAFRTLRASLSLSPTAKKARILLVTSANPRAGKSLVSSNLAIVLAHNGLRTLIVDCDLRRPSQGRAFSISGGMGLAHVLAEETEWRNVVIESGIDNLDIICVGQIPPNPAELLGSPSMKRLLTEAQETYDKIILDSPPVFGLSDPLILMPQADGVIFVAHFNNSRRRSIAHALQKLRTGDTPIVGGVMNNVDLRRPGGYYYYKHQYAQYYGGYGSQKPKKT